MSNWTISVAQLPIGNTGQFHNMILIRDETGRIQEEIDGGPADGNGELISIESGKAFNAYTSGTFPIGARIFPRATYYQQDLPESDPLFSGTRSQVQNRLEAARETIASFDPRYRYVLTGGPVTDYQTGEQTPGFNSNSVAATLLWAMGIDPNSPLIPNKATPGSDRLLLELPQIRDLIQRRNLNAPEGDRIPLPPAPSEKRGDGFDGSYDFASLQPDQPMPAAPWGGPAQTDPQNIRVLSRFIRAPDGSLVPAPLGVPDRPQTPSYDDRSAGRLGGRQPMPGIFGLPDP